MLEKLKSEHQELLRINNIKCGLIGVELQAYSKIFTGDVDIIDWDKNSKSNVLSEEKQCEAYERANNALKAKQEHTDGFINAVKENNADLIKMYDLFKEIGDKAKEDDL